MTSSLIFRDLCSPKLLRVDTRNRIAIGSPSFNAFPSDKPAIKLSPKRENAGTSSLIVPFSLHPNSNPFPPFACTLFFNTNQRMNTAMKAVQEPFHLFLRYTVLIFTNKRIDISGDRSVDVTVPRAGLFCCSLLSAIAFPRLVDRSVAFSCPTGCSFLYKRGGAIAEK